MNRVTWRRFAIGAVAVLAITQLVACSGRGDVAGEPSGDASFPTKDITLVVPYSAGGNSDTAARAMTPVLEQELGVSVVVQNREGANGTIGLEYLGSRPADGYSIGIMTIDSILWQYQGYNLSPFDWEHVAQISETPTAIAVGPDSPYTTLTELVDAAKAKPDTVTIALNGIGTNPESVVRELETLTGATFRLVPFDGGAPAVTAAMGGQVDAVVAGTGETSQPHADGLLTVLSVLTEEENPALPGVPTAVSEGIDLVNVGWAVVVVPKGTPEAVRVRIQDAVAAAVASEGFAKATQGLGNLPRYRDGADLQQFVQSELDRVEAVFG